MVATVTTSPGSDKILVATQGDIEVEGTEDPGATGDPRDSSGHVTEAYGDATTTMASVPVSSGGDKVLVATSGDVAMGGTEDPSVTDDPRDALGRVSEAYADATTMVATVTTSPGGDKVLVATSGDVTMEVTATPEATGDPRDTLGHLSDVTGDATTTAASVPVSPGGDKALVATSADVAMEGTEDPSATGDPRGALRCVTEAYGDATTTMATVTTSPGSDKMLVAPGEDVAMEGTAQPGATNCSWDTLGRVPEVPGDATTTVASVPVSPGGDKALLATSGDIAVEGTEDPSATGDPRDTLGFITEAYGDATTVVAPVSTSPGSDKVLVATSGDVAMEGTAQTNITSDPRDTLGHVTEAYGDATTTMASVPVSPGDDKALVATSGDVAMEGTAQPDVTSDPRDTLGHVTEAYADATTVVAPVSTSPGSDKMLVAPGEDVAMEGTAQPGATNCSWDTLGRVPEVPGDATTTVASVPVSPGCDKALEATSGDVAMEVTEDPSVTSGLGDTLGHVTEAYGDATITMAPLTTSSGGDKVLVATSGDIAVEGTEDPGATGDPRDSSGHVTEAYGDATTTMASVPVSSGGDKFLVATTGDVTMEGTAQPEATGDPRDTLGRVSEAYGDATTMVATVTVSPGGDKAPVATSADVAMEVTAPPGATNTSGDPLGRAPDVPPGATTPVPNAIMVAPGGDVAVGGPAPPPPCHAHSFPVTAAAPPPPGPPGLSGSAPSSSPLPLLLLLLLPLPLLLP
nr:mucin-1-like [Taeniopygia guttata]